MEQRNENTTENRLPNEVVEVYRQPGPQEVVEVYSRLLPWLKTAQPAPAIPARPRQKLLWLWVFLGCFAVTAALAVAAHLLQPEPEPETDDDPFFKWHGEIQIDRDEASGEITIPSWPVGQGAELDVTRQHGEVLTIQEVYKKVNPSVVTVVAHLKDAGSVGTGVIFTEDGYILTNHHIVKGGQLCTVILDTGYSYDAKYVAGDAENDLAILKVDEAGLPAAEFGDSDDLTVGDPAYAIGNPLGVELRGTLTDGIISAINRDVEVDGRTMTLLQTNAALNTGNSGGPLINQYGQVVGINVIKMSSAYASVEGLGFAIPTSSIDRIVNDLLTYGELKPEPLLGVSVSLVSTEVEPDVWGLEVVDVVSGAAADLAGVQVGDYVLFADGDELRTSQDLLRVRRQHHLDEQMTLTLWRDGTQIDVTLQLKEAVE